MTCLSAGESQAIVVSQGDQTALIDCGSDDEWNAADTVCEYLDWWGYDRIDVMVLTALDSSHAGGAVTLADRIPVDMVYLPYDEETAELDNGKRVHMSRSNAKCKPYELTRPDDITYGFGEKGVLNIIFTQTQYNQDNDKLITLEDGTQAWICDYIDSSPTPPSEPTTPDETEDLCAKITFKGEQELKIGGNYKTLTGSFVDKDGNTTSDIGEWDVITIDELKPYVDYTITDNILKIKILENDFADSGKVRITFSNSDGTTSTYLDFEIVTMF